MSSRKGFDAGQLLAGLGALLLITSLFADWYQRSGGQGASLNGWDSFEVVDLLLVFAALTVFVAAIPLGEPGRRIRQIAPELERWALPAAAAAVALVFFVLIDKPPAAISGSLEIGSWLALVGALAMLGGLTLSRTGVSLIIQVSSDTGPTPIHDPDETRTVDPTEIKSKDGS